MNAPPDSECSSLTLDFASQVLGKTTIIEGIIGWYIDQDPSSMLFVHPTETGAEYWSKNRLRPLIENCPVLTELIDANLSRKTFRNGAGGNTIAHIRYPGGYLILLGSNSGAMLRAHTARVTICDEVDAYPASASGGKSNATDDGEG